MAQPSNPKIFIAAIQQLPPLMKQVINNPALIDNSIAIGQKYNLTPRQEDMIMSIERQVIVQQLPVAAIPAEFKKLRLPPEQEKNLTQDFLGRIILPMEWHVGSVQPLIQSLGGRAEEYLAEARQQFPEVYTPELAHVRTGDQTGATEHPLLKNFDDRMATPRGRAGLLLRLSGLAGQVDELMKTETISQSDGEDILRNLDTLSYAVNTQDLNPLEIQSLKRRLRKVVARLVEVQG